MSMRSLMNKYSVGSTFFKSISPLRDCLQGFRFRGDGREIRDIFGGGFEKNGDNTSIISHVRTPANSFYVSMTYKISQAVKYGDGFSRIVYAAQPPIVSNVQLSYAAEKSSGSFMQNDANLYSTFESEVAALGFVSPENIYAAQRIHGSGRLHVSELVQYNPQFKPITFEIEVPSAQDDEVETMERYFMKNYPGDFKSGTRFIRMAEAKQIAEALLAHDAANFNVGNLLPVSARQIIQRLPSDLIEDQVVTRVLECHHDYMIQQGYSPHKKVFFSQSLQNKSEILNASTANPPLEATKSNRK